MTCSPAVQLNPWYPAGPFTQPSPLLPGARRMMACSFGRATKTGRAAHGVMGSRRLMCSSDSWAV